MANRKALHSPSRPESIVAFHAWLTANGAEVLKPTNEWEACRFRGMSGVSIIYLNARGRVTYTGVAQKAWTTFVAGGVYRLTPSVAIRMQRDVVLRTIIDRDGPACFYCDEEPTDDNMPTREHLVSRTHGGPDHIANQFLACTDCNRRAGHLSAVEKIRLRDQLRKARRQASAALAAVLGEVGHA